MIDIQQAVGRGFESRRNHERRVSASSTAGAKRERERVEFTQTSFSFCFVLPYGNACALYTEDSKGEALSEADLGLRSSQSRPVCYCRADSVKDKRKRSQSPLKILRDIFKKLCSISI